MMFWSGHDMSGWGYTGMAIGMLLLWILVVVGVVTLIRLTTGDSQVRAIPQRAPHAESPEWHLAARFARGEIDEAEYRQRLAVLRTTAV